MSSLTFSGNSELPEIPTTIAETQNINNVHDNPEPVKTSSLTTVTLNIPILGIPESRHSEIPIQHVASSSASLSSGTTTTVYSTINKSKCSTKTDDTSIKIEQNPVVIQQNSANLQTKPEAIEPAQQEGIVKINRENVPEISVSCNNVPRSEHETNLKRKCDETSDCEPPSKQPKQNILNHSLPFLNLSNNHPLKKHSKINRNGENVKSSPKVVILENDIIVPSASVSSGVKNDHVLSPPKPIVLSKIIPITHSAKSSTSVTLSKSIMSTKASIIPPKLPSTTYVGQKPPCYMPKTSYSPVLNVPKPVTVNAR